MVYAYLIQRIICREDDYTFYTKQPPYLAGNFMSHKISASSSGMRIGRKIITDSFALWST